MFARVLAALALLTLAGAAGPATSSAGWSRLADPPFLRSGSVRVWTGQELLVWGGYERDGAAYDPRLDRWRRLPRAPFALNQASAVWVAGRMVAYGALLDGGNRSRTRYARGVAYLPDRNRWQVLAPFRLSPQASTITAVG